MGAAGAKANPSPGLPGTGMGSSSTAMAWPSANLKPMQVLQAMKPMTPSQGQSLRPGQAAPPMGQTPYNPWGKNRGGSGLLPLYRRPGTMPE